MRKINTHGTNRWSCISNATALTKSSKKFIWAEHPKFRLEIFYELSSLHRYHPMYRTFSQPFSLLTTVIHLSNLTKLFSLAETILFCTDMYTISKQSMKYHARNEHTDRHINGKTRLEYIVLYFLSSDVWFAETALWKEWLWKAGALLFFYCWCFPKSVKFSLNKYFNWKVWIYSIFLQILTNVSSVFFLWSTSLRWAF